MKKTKRISSPSTEGLSPLLFLHRLTFARRIARRMLHGLTLRQKFHGGIIYLDAVEHSWAWTGKRRYEKFDVLLQDTMLSLSSHFKHLIDIGCNVGAMSLSVLLRNAQATALCIDPNSRAISLLRQSVRANNLDTRIIVKEAAITDHDGFECYDGAGSVTGHLSREGISVKSLDILRIVDEAALSQLCLVKIDVEGYELRLLKRLLTSKSLSKLCLVVELHPKSFNDMSDPESALALLSESGARIRDLNRVSPASVNREEFSQVVCTWL